MKKPCLQLLPAGCTTTSTCYKRMSDYWQLQLGGCGMHFLIHQISDQQLNTNADFEVLGYKTKWRVRVWWFGPGNVQVNLKAESELYVESELQD